MLRDPVDGLVVPALPLPPPLLLSPGTVCSGGFFPGGGSPGTGPFRLPGDPGDPTIRAHEGTVIRDVLPGLQPDLAAGEGGVVRLGDPLHPLQFASRLGLTGGRDPL